MSRLQKRIYVDFRGQDAQSLGVTVPTVRGYRLLYIKLIVVLIHSITDVIYSDFLVIFSFKQKILYRNVHNTQISQYLYWLRRFKYRNIKYIELFWEFCWQKSIRTRCCGVAAIILRTRDENTNQIARVDDSYFLLFSCCALLISCSRALDICNPDKAGLSMREIVGPLWPEFFHKVITHVKYISSSVFRQENVYVTTFQVI